MLYAFKVLFLGTIIYFFAITVVSSFHLSEISKKNWRSKMKPFVIQSMIKTRISKGQDVPRDVPGQSGTGRPVVPLSRDKKKSCPGVSLSRDKGRSKCPGTISSFPARPETKRFKIFQKKETRFPILEHHFSVLEHPFLF